MLGFAICKICKKYEKSALKLFYDHDHQTLVVILSLSEYEHCDYYLKNNHLFNLLITLLRVEAKVKSDWIPKKRVS